MIDIFTKNICAVGLNTALVPGVLVFLLMIGEAGKLAATFSPAVFTAAVATNSGIVTENAAF